MDEQVYRDMYEQEDRHWWFGGRRAVIWALLGRAGVSGPLCLLDAGCGTGRNLVEYGVLGEAHGIDPSDTAVAACHERGLSRVQRGEIEHLPHADASFDLILVTDVLEHLDDDAVALAELRRVAKPGATLLVTVPALSWLWSDEDVTLHHRRRYRRAQLVSVVRAAGFEPVVTTYYNTVLLPPIALARKLRNSGPGAARPSEIDRSSGRLSGALELPLRGEAALIARGGTLPIGVSVGLAARAR